MIPASCAGASSTMNQKSILITGGASGIGKAIALEFASLGASVLIADIDEAAGARTLDIVRRSGGNGTFVKMDLADPADVRNAIDFIEKAQGKLDCLINNAAMLGRLAPCLDLEYEDFAEVIRTNLVGTFHLSQLAAKSMIAHRTPGVIINISTIQTSSPVPEYSAYVASKGGIDALTLAMAVDLSPHDIRVNGIAVGSVYTDSFRKVMPKKFRQEEENSDEVPPILDQKAATLLRRMGRPREIAKVVAFLASENAGYMTGSIARLDGGRLISRKPEPL